MAMDNATLNGLARSGRDVRLYSSLDETRTAEKLARHPSFTVVSEQIKARAGETLLETAISLQKAGFTRRHSRLFIWRFLWWKVKHGLQHGGPADRGEVVCCRRNQFY